MFCFLFFFLIIGCYFLIRAVIAQIFNLTSELVIPIGIQTNEAKATAQPVTAEETKISKF